LTGAITLRKPRAAMPTFNESATAYFANIDPSGGRRTLWEQFRSIGLPTTDDEVWRYAPLGHLDLERYVAGEAGGPVTPRDVGDDGPASVRVDLVNGALVGAVGSVRGVTVQLESTPVEPDVESFINRFGQDAFALLNGALSPGTLRIAIDADVRVNDPIVLVNTVTSTAAFPSVRIDVARGASVEVVEYLVGGDDALVSSLGHYVVGEGARLAITTCQRLAATCWHVARSTAIVGQDARVRQSSVGLGAFYNRSRNDAEFTGPGGENELRTTYLGVGDQVHDYRTHQLHRVGRTKSSLLSKGAVSDHARSVYTGLIEIEKGAKRTDARQRNFNLLLSPTAHADTVPNLDIKENDVLCAHASSVGPLDAEQRWYLESRGVERSEAERLLVQGFFAELTSEMPAAVAALVGRDVAAALARTAAAT
jgi:Fe-S cluster assembly protein SufD